MKQIKDKHTVKANNGLTAGIRNSANRKTGIEEDFNNVESPVAQVFQQTLVKVAAVTATMVMALIIKMRRNKNRLRMYENLLDFEYNF